MKKFSNFVKNKKVLSALIVLAMSASGGVTLHAEDAETSTLVTNVTNINIYKTDEVKGTELGDNARARGTGSIATGTNSLAIGTNAVATGGNESKESIEAKLAENQAKLNEISELEDKTDTLATELTDIRNTYASVIEAGQRVEAAKEAKNNAYKSWQEKLTTYNTAVTDSKAYLEEQQAKIDDLNSRLTGVSQLTNTDISSDEGLTKAANELKAIAEEGTTLNLSTNFYKDYVSSYYAALGDLRQAQIVYSKSSPTHYMNTGSTDYSVGKETIINAYSFGNVYNDRPIAVKIYYMDGLYTSSSASDKNLYPSAFKNSTVTKIPSAVLYLKNINTDITTLEEYETAQAASLEWKASLQQFWTDCDNPMMTEEAKKALINESNIRVDYYLKTNEITYYQGKYEETGDTTWLDKKKTALTELSEIQNTWDTASGGKALIKQTIDQYKEDNITSISEKNKITTETLTSELETALGISKDAVTQKQKELENLKKEAEQAKTNYENINPSQQDEYLAAQYAEVMKKLEDKATELQTSQERLDALKAALTLNDLSNVGENTMAVGTNALSTGNNSMAVGTAAVATGENAIAVGNGAIVTGDNSIAIGTGNAVLGDRSGAFGDPNTVYGSGSYAIGNDNTIGKTDPETNVPLADKGNNTFVFGNNITTTVNNSVILGNGSKDDGRDNVVSVGDGGDYSRQIINVKAGTENTDAANYGQLANSQSVTEGEGAEQKTTYTAYEADRDGIVTVKTNDGGVAFKIKMSADASDKANIDASNIGKNRDNEADRLESLADWGDALGAGEISYGNRYLVTGNTMYLELRNISSTNYISSENTTAVNLSLLDTQIKKNADNIENLSNISPEGKTNIKNLAKEAVQVAAGTNIEVSHTDDEETGNRTYTISAKMGNVEKGDNRLVSGDSVASAIENAISENNTGIESKLADKANIDASNIGNYFAGTDEEKKENLKAWAEALGGGTVAEGSYQLVTGDTVYNYFKTYEGAASSKELVKEIETRESLIKAGENNTIYIGSGISGDKIDISNSEGESRVITGVKTDPTNESSVANVGYVNTVYNSIQNGMDQLESRLTDDNKTVGAVSAALAGLKPMAYTPDDKLGFAVATGTYRGTTATAIGAFYQPNEDIMFNLASTIGASHNAWNAGISFKFGRKSEKAKAKEEAANARIESLERAVAQLARQNEELASRINDNNRRPTLDLSKKSSFPDVPKDHWAKEAVDTLKGNGDLHGYPDGKFHGDQQMTRYEYAQMLYNALKNGNQVEQAEIDRYAPELSEIIQSNF